MIDVSGQLPVNKNYSWADLCGWRKLEDLTTIALHHDAYQKANRKNYTPVQMMSEIANDHIKSTKNEKKGDAGFPYHFYVIRGQAYLTNPIALYTYGIGGNNPYTIHICVHGHYKDYDQLTDEDLNCVIALCIMLKGNMPAYKAVKGHAELNSSACPGYDMNRVREAITTAEHRIASGDTWEQKKNKVSQLANQYNYMFNLMQRGEADGNSQWAMENLLAVRQIMIERKLLDA